MPYRFVNLKTHETNGRFTNPAEIGSYILEYGTFSRLTGDPHIFRRRQTGDGGALPSPLTDRPDRVYDRHRDRRVAGPIQPHGGRIDSYYEYLLKGAILFDDPELWAMWQDTIAAVNAYVADESCGGLWNGHVYMRTDKKWATASGALYAFFPAVLALS
jgi:mannosidase alpha-like ER degradation enhancer 2